MEKEIEFLNNYYQKAVQLSKDFSITRNYEWTPLLILNELSVWIVNTFLDNFYKDNCRRY